MILTVRPKTTAEDRVCSLVCSAAADGWDTSRNATGYLQADPVKFPGGIPALTSQLHAQGFKFGIYAAASSVVCSGRPGSLYLEDR